MSRILPVFLSSCDRSRPVHQLGRAVRRDLAADRDPCARDSWHAWGMFVEARNLPAHVGIIMDGNGRWAQLRGEDRTVGHREGAKAVRRIVRASRRLGLRALTLYAFSEQNWARPDGEVDALMALLQDFLVSE